MANDSGPVRVQLSRRKGWRMPPNTVKVDRTTRWGNPFRPTVNGEQAIRESVALFRRLLEQQPLPTEELHGKNLACWCPLQDQHGNAVPCHADVLISLANDIPLDEVIRENLRRSKGEAL